MTRQRADYRGARLASASVAVLAAGAAAIVVLWATSTEEALPALSVTAPTPQAGSATYCPPLLDDLPEELADRPQRPVASTSPYVAAWGDPAVVLRCGVPAPSELTPTSSLLNVNGVDWLRTTSATGQAVGVVWTAVGRVVYVDVAIPSSDTSQEAVLSPLSTLIAETVPSVDS